MRVLLLNQFYPPDTAATGQLLADVARSMAADGHEVHVLCSRGAYSGGRLHRSPRVTAAGVRVHRVGALGLGRSDAARRLADWGSFCALAAPWTMLLPHPDVCCSLTTPPLIAAAGIGLKRLRGTRLVVWTMDLWPDVAEATGALKADGVLCRTLKQCARRVYGEADAVVSLGRTMTERLVGNGVPARKIRTVHNWAPGEAVRPLPWGGSYLSGLEGLDGRFVVMYAGNLGTPHEFGTILDAAYKLRSDSGILFLFVGSGSRRAAVQAETRRRGLANVRFADPVRFGRLSELLGSACVHLVSMREEVLGCLVPSKTYGIMAAARPGVLVGPRASEPARLFRASGGGFNVGPGDSNGLVAVLRRLRDRPGLAAQMGSAARSYYEANLGRDRSVGSIKAALTGNTAR